MTNGTITIISIKAKTADGGVGEVAYHGVGNGKVDAKEVYEEVQCRLRTAGLKVRLEWIVGPDPDGMPDAEGVLRAVFRAWPEMWGPTGQLIPPPVGVLAPQTWLSRFGR